MGRREDPVEPGPLFEFAQDLRALRAATGRTYRDLAQRAGYSASALSAAAKGEVLPSLEVTLAYVGACGGDMAQWEQRWLGLAGPERVDAPEATGPETRETPDTPPLKERDTDIAEITDFTETTSVVGTTPITAVSVLPMPDQLGARRRRVRWITAAAVVLALGGTGFLVWRLTDHPVGVASGPDTTGLVGSTNGGAGSSSAGRAQSGGPTGSGSHGTSLSPGAPAPGGGGGAQGSGPAGGGGQPGTSTAGSGGAGNRNPAPPPNPPPGQAAPVVTFNGLAGEDCPQGSTKGTWDSGSDAWGQRSGGWTGDGCAGTFVSARVSGSNVYHWWLAISPVSTGSCTLSVYVPAGGSADSSTSAGYVVIDQKPYDTSNRVGRFTVDQRDNQGKWVSVAGSYPIRSGYLQVELTSSDSTSGTVAAAAIRATCQP